LRGEGEPDESRHGGRIGVGRAAETKP